MSAVLQSPRDQVQLHLASGAAVYLGMLAEHLVPPPPMSVDEWADSHRVLPRKGASEPGKWRTERTPYLREIMLALSPDDPAERIVFMAGAQVGKTECGNNWCGFVIDHAPAPMMIVQPTVDVAQRWSRQRLAPMIEETDVLRAKIKPSRSRDSGNTTLLKEFPGGLVIVSGANSAAGLRSMPIRYLMLDEIDAYPHDVDGEGSPIALAERRTATFPRRKILLTSTPTLTDSSRIEKEFAASDQRRYHVPCPLCGELLVLVDSQLDEDGLYLCDHCGEQFGDHHKPAMLEAGEWIADHPGRPVRGYHLNSLYSPLGLGYTWAEIAAERAKARKDPALLKSYTNTLLGLPYDDASSRVEPDALLRRREAWPMRSVPDGALILTVGVDVQANRFAVMVVGWGRGEVAWLIDYVELPANPTDPESWRELDRYLTQPLANAYGATLRPSLIAIDSGNWTHEVYQYVRARKHVIAIKGQGAPGKPLIGRPSRQDVRATGRTIRHGVQLWHVGTDAAKHSIMARLLGDADAEPGARRIRVPEDFTQETVEQICSEQYDADRRRWVRIIGRRNEALDCLVYAYAAACHPAVRVHTKRDADWQRLEDQLQPRTGDLFAPRPETDPETDPAPSAQPAPRRRRAARPGGSAGLGSSDWCL